MGIERRVLLVAVGVAVAAPPALGGGHLPLCTVSEIQHAVRQSGFWERSNETSAQRTHTADGRRKQRKRCPFAPGRYLCEDSVFDDREWWYRTNWKGQCDIPEIEEVGSSVKPHRILLVGDSHLRQSYIQAACTWHHNDVLGTMDLFVDGMPYLYDSAQQGTPFPCHAYSRRAYPKFFIGVRRGEEDVAPNSYDWLPKNPKRILRQQNVSVCADTQTNAVSCLASSNGATEICFVHVRYWLAHGCTLGVPLVVSKKGSACDCPRTHSCVKPNGRCSGTGHDESSAYCKNNRCGQAYCESVYGANSYCKNGRIVPTTSTQNETHCRNAIMDRVASWATGGKEARTGNETWGGPAIGGFVSKVAKKGPFDTVVFNEYGAPKQQHAALKDTLYARKFRGKLLFVPNFQPGYRRVVEENTATLQIDATPPSQEQLDADNAKDPSTLQLTSEEAAESHRQGGSWWTGSLSLSNLIASRQSDSKACIYTMESPNRMTHLDPVTGAERALEASACREYHESRVPPSFMNRAGTEGCYHETHYCMPGGPVEAITKYILAAAVAGM